SFEIFGNVGIYYIMFLAGLEMDMEGMKRQKLKGVAFGLTTFLLPFLAGWLIGLHVLHFSTWASLLVACILSSHTLVSYPIVSRYGIQKHPMVVASIIATMIALLLALFVLAGISGLLQGHDSNLFWVYFTVRVAIYITAVIMIVPRCCRFFFRRNSEPTILFAFVLVVVFLCGGIARLIGLEGIFGAFLAGLVMSRYIPHVSPLATRIEFVGNALFIPYFLIGIGMLIDVRSLSHSDTLLILALLLTAGTLAKAMAARLTGRLFGYGRTACNLMFGLTEAHAAGALAMVMVGIQLETTPGRQLMSNDMLNGVVLMILCSCIISSVATERASRQLATTENVNTTEPSGHSEQFMVSIGNPDHIGNLMQLAILLRRKKSAEPIVVLSIVNEENTSKKKEQVCRRNLEQAARMASAADVPVKTVLRYGLHLAQSMIHTAKENGITDLVIGLHHRQSAFDSFWGNTLEHIIKNTGCQITITKLLMPANTLRRIVVAIPDKAEFERGFGKWVVQLCRMAATLGCRIHFWSTTATLNRVRGIAASMESVRAEYRELDEWDDLLLLTGQVAYDHMLIIVSARPGSISYQASFELLPIQISKYFANNSLMMIYPDLLGEALAVPSFFNPVRQTETRFYDIAMRWLYKWTKRK
ncbi:MAG: cation:proton antiporter, partial [Bacteroidales bacterium]|nr:cation:proton antiporter [Bacteroidales bacterium]